mgnify:CR=1 FL=1
MTRALPKELEDARREIEKIARGYGLDFYKTIFELLEDREVNEVASYGGFPVRYPSWRFGMEYDRLSKEYRYGLSKIYEMVINNDPAYAYLMRSNGLVDQKMVMAHVYGHVDFFKNNLWFGPTDRRMVDAMANHGTRIRRAVDEHGLTAVEDFLDVALALDNLIDPYGSYGPTRAEEPRDLAPRKHKGARAKRATTSIGSPRRRATAIWIATSIPRKRSPRKPGGSRPNTNDRAAIPPSPSATSSDS